MRLTYWEKKELNCLGELTKHLQDVKANINNYRDCLKTVVEQQKRKQYDNWYNRDYDQDRLDSYAARHVNLTFAIGALVGSGDENHRHQKFKSTKWNNVTGISSVCTFRIWSTKKAEEIGEEYGNIEKEVDAMLEVMTGPEEVHDALLEKQAAAATKIQSLQRGGQAKKELENRKAAKAEKAATKIQRAVRGKKAAKKGEGDGRSVSLFRSRNTGEEGGRDKETKGNGLGSD